MGALLQHEAEVEEFCQKATVHLLSRGLMLEARREKLELAVPLGGPGPTFIKQFVSEGVTMESWRVKEQSPS